MSETSRTRGGEPAVRRGGHGRLRVSVNKHPEVTRLVYLRVPVYLRWRALGVKGRMLTVARDGLLGGGAIGLLSLLSPGEPIASSPSCRIA